MLNAIANFFYTAMRTRNNKAPHTSANTEQQSNTTRDSTSARSDANANNATMGSKQSNGTTTQPAAASTAPSTNTAPSGTTNAVPKSTTVAATVNNADEHKQVETTRSKTVTPVDDLIDKFQIPASPVHGWWCTAHMLDQPR